ncbi:hypothetical protein JS278_00092 [Acidipropionibacterium virtanenii]|uniref:Toxin n=2 Tax=Acidipropionibacterium virtanenii TaxID=2057246 RepID=A0A344UPU1_9ACTN|nr:hypothetical protein JS278_00092 [Acidipropionibacterium virtanenii]
MRMARSAFKHGCTGTDIDVALKYYVTRQALGEGPERWLYTGFDTAGRPLEIVTILGDDGKEAVIHAMALRTSYRPTRKGHRS